MLLGSAIPPSELLAVAMYTQDAREKDTRLKQVRRGVEREEVGLTFTRFKSLCSLCGCFVAADAICVSAARVLARMDRSKVCGPPPP